VPRERYLPTAPEGAAQGVPSAEEHTGIRLADRTPQRVTAARTESVAAAVYGAPGQVVAGAEGLLDGEEAGDGAGALESEADEADEGVGGKGLAAFAENDAAVEHGQGPAQGEAGDEDLGIEVVHLGALIEVAGVLGVEGAAVEAVPEAVLVAEMFGFIKHRFDEFVSLAKAPRRQGMLELLFGIVYVLLASHLERPGV
jgi:hypothetical protein